MISKLKKLIFSRNTILIAAIFLGLFLNGLSSFFESFNIYVLAIVMVFSMSGISTSGLLPVSKSLKIMGVSVFLGYFVFSTLLLVISWFFIKDTYLFYGMVVIAASPPGIAVIPFTHYLRGDMNYSMLGTLGAYLSSIFIAPLVIYLFSESSVGLSPVQIALVMLKIVIVPFLLSRLLRFKKVYPVVEKVRGRVVDLGFALIIYVAVGINRQVFFENFDVLLIISFIFFISMFVLGWLHNILSNRLKITSPVKVSQNLLLTIKSSGFTASVSLAIFGKEAAVPSAIMSVFVLVYLIYLSIKSQSKYKE